MPPDTAYCWGAKPPQLKTDFCEKVSARRRSGRKRACSQPIQWSFTQKFPPLGSICACSPPRRGASTAAGGARGSAPGRLPAPPPSFPGSCRGAYRTVRRTGAHFVPTGVPAHLEDAARASVAVDEISALQGKAVVTRDVRGHFDHSCGGGTPLISYHENIQTHEVKRTFCPHCGGRADVSLSLPTGACGVRPCTPAAIRPPRAIPSSGDDSGDSTAAGEGATRHYYMDLYFYIERRHPPH